MSQQHFKIGPTFLSKLLIYTRFFIPPYTLLNNNKFVIKLVNDFIDQKGFSVGYNKSKNRESIAKCHFIVGNTLKELSAKIKLKKLKKYPDHNILKKRFIQEIIAENWEQINKEVSNKIYKNEELNCIEFKNVTIDFKKCTIKLHARLFLKKCVRFLSIWGYISLFPFSILNQRIKKSGSSKSIKSDKGILLYDVPAKSYEIDGSDIKFINFINKKILPPDYNYSVHSYLIEKKIPSDGHFKYSKYPILSLLSDVLSLRNFPKLIYFQIVALIDYIFTILSCPKHIILSVDYAWQGVVEFLSERNSIVDIYTTNSSFTKQPLWMTNYYKRTYSLNMIWFSTNNKGLTYFQHNSETIYPVFFPFLFLQYDCGIYWTQEQANWFSTFFPEARSKIIGPILFYHPEDVNYKLENNKFVISVFDVTPITKEAEDHFGIIYNYYETSNTKNFVQDIVDTARLLNKEMSYNIIIKIKQKRSPSWMHDKTYYNMLEDFKNKYRFFEVVDCKSDIYTMIGNSDISISIPYSSPVYIASSLNKQGLFYDPTGNLAPFYDRDKNVNFYSGKEELKKALTELINLKNNPAGEK